MTHRTDPAEQLTDEIMLLFMTKVKVGKQEIVALIHRYYPPKRRRQRLKKGPILKHLDAIWKAGMNDLEKPPKRRRKQSDKSVFEQDMERYQAKRTSKRRAKKTTGLQPG